MQLMLLLSCLCLAATSAGATSGWVSDKKTGCQVWMPSDFFTDISISWSGGCRNGKANGSGTLKKYKGNKWFLALDGVMEDGQCHHDCSITTIGGNKYFGDLKDNMYHGKGTFLYRDGRKYVGEFQENKIHGHGIMIYQNGDRYSGSWMDGKPHGKGVYTFMDGSSYQGLWERGERIKVF